MATALLSSLTSGVGDFVSRRRRPLTVIAGLAGGAYLVASYARGKLEDLQEGMGKRRASRENLRRRFQQNQEDCGFTVQALLPSLGTQILEGMDVEGLTARLSILGKGKSKAPTPAAQQEPTVDEKPNGILPTVNGDVHGQQTELDPSAKPFVPSSEAPTANGEEAVAEETMPSEMPTIPSAYDLASHAGPPKLSAPPPPLPIGLEASTASLATPNASAFLPAKTANGFEALADAPAPHVVLDPPAPLPATNGDLVQDKGKSKYDGLSKAEVWAELKLLSFARLFTSVYSLALLALQTHVQLNLLGRYAYVSSVLAMAEDEGDGLDLLDGLDDARLKPVDLRTERRYLTFSWWLLHRGWEEVALRVREKVDEVVGPMGLKETLSAKDLKRVVDEIRRKVEFEDDGAPFSFSAALFPPTTVSELETLRAGGMPPHDCVVDPPLRDLLDETADFIDAPDFPCVLGACVGRVFELVLEKVGEAAGLAPSEEEVAAAAATAQSGPGGAAGQPFIHPRMRFQELQEGQADEAGKKVRLANLLPVVSRQAHLVLNGLPNDCAEALNTTRDLYEFSSLVYTLS